MSNETQPEIRFPGFTEDWKQRKLIEGVSKIGDGLHGTPSYSEDGDVFFINGNNLVNGKISITKETKFVNESDQSKDDKSLNVNTILMSINGTIGNLAWYNNEKVMLGKSIAYLTVSDFDKNFVYFYLQTPMMRKYFISNLTGTTIKNLGLKTIRNTELFVTDLDEQQKIGTFFKQLDDTIALHQRKLDLLKETKKGFLQKMFPKNGAKVPEVRFPGFTEDWEERKFGEIVQVSRGLTYKPSDVQIEGIRVLRSSNINEDVFVLRDDDVFVKPDAVNIAPIKNGDILITSANGSSRLVGKHAIVNGLQDKTVHGGFMLRVKSKNTWFTNSLMSSRWYNYFINIYVSGGNGAIGNLRKYDLESQTIIVPDDEEQQKIGAFFKQLDDTIALHQRKLDLLKETKKGFLQKMFV
ncbi:restriction endonuclease subunit S [Enterococcus faecium]|uniref:restriction endonuclease subunit S n=1 Tax=Enterococcus faecium TaxID=1352 RepID=UPI00190EA291|nr:restriction endonuclease subunit S [Enterococcus faecium]EHM3038931.1 restriction endonuclease subunit S [Enterococcus faecium]MDQ8554327.1 restriction endonuclease subunit S [Enterococcus faecium]